jgi:hypothetical protein
VGEVGLKARRLTRQGQEKPRSFAKKLDASGSRLSTEAWFGNKQPAP